MNSAVLEFWQILIDVFGLFLFVFPLGYLLLSLIPSEKGGFSSLNFFLRMPIYLAVGMAGSVVILFFVGHLLFNLYVILLLLGFFWFIFLYEQKVWVKLQQLDLSKILSGLSGSVKLGLVPLSLFLFSLCHFVFIAYSMGGWCPPGDCVWHGMRVSLIKNYQNMAPSNIPSVWNEALSTYFPRGFYVFSVAASLLTDTYPGEAVLIVATSVSALIPSMLFTMVYQKTKSKPFSFIAFLMAYIAPGGNPYPMREYSLFASYLQGVYTSFFGILLTLTFFCIVVCFDDFSKRWIFQFKRHLFSVLILVFAIAITYYSFFPFIAIYLLVRMLLPHGQRLKIVLSSKNFLFVFGLVLFALIVFLPQIVFIYFNLRSAVLKFLWLEPRWLVSYFVPFSFFYSNENGVLVVVSLLLTLFFVRYRKYQSLILLYLCFAVPLLLSMNYELYTDFLWFLTPFRALIAFIALSYVVFAIFLHSISIRFVEKIRSESFSLRKINQHLSSWRVLVYVFVVIMFTSLVYASFVFLPSSGGRPVGDDYDALVWIDQHVSPDDLVLNDRSMIGLFLPSFSIKNVVFLPEPDWPKPVLDRMLECFSIFDDPANTTYIEETLWKYDIKYVFVSSLDVYYDFWHGYEYSPPLVRRPYNASQILGFFDSNPDLFYQEFRRDSVGVYRVLSSS